MEHRHTFEGQALEHDHEGGAWPHGYYGHPEDKGSPVYGAGTYKRLGKTTPEPSLLARVTAFINEQLSRDDMSLEEIAGEVITMVTEASPAAAELARVEASITEDGGDCWADAEALGARDSLRRVVAAEQGAKGTPAEDASDDQDEDDGS